MTNVHPHTNSRSFVKEYEYTHELPYMMSALPGIMWAGLIYAGMAMALPLLFATIGVITGGTSFSATVLLSVLITAVVGLVLGMIVAMVAGGIAIYLVWIGNKTFGNPISGRNAMPISGGLAGFIATTWTVFFFDGSDSGIGLAALILFGPVMATVVGHLATSFFERSYLFSKTTIVAGGKQLAFQFQIRHMFALTAWAAAVIAISSAIGNYWLVPMFVFWVAMEIGLSYLTWIKPEPERTGAYPVTTTESRE